jgi:DNA-binding LytR/AlgR family response regulator
VNRPTALLAEDEPLLRAEIRGALNSLWPELFIAAEAGDGIEAIQAFDRYAPDIVFLDIQMPGKSGLEVAEHACAGAHVVFITAFDEHAVAAFEQGALDYVLKPISISRLKLTVARLQKRLRQPPADLRGLIELLGSVVGKEPSYLKWLTVPQGLELRVVTMSEISYFRADNKYTTVATRNRLFLLNSSLKQIKDKLDPAMFWQINRGIIVNVGAIETIFRSMRGALDVKLKERSELLPVSAAHAHLFKQL